MEALKGKFPLHVRTIPNSMKPFVATVVQDFHILVDRVPERKSGFLCRVRASDSHRPSEISSRRINGLASLAQLGLSLSILPGERWYSLPDTGNDVRVWSTHVTKMTSLN